jgi:hypothetical protein
VSILITGHRGINTPWCQYLGKARPRIPVG